MSGRPGRLSAAAKQIVGLAPSRQQSVESLLGAKKMKRKREVTGSSSSPACAEKDSDGASKTRADTSVSSSSTVAEQVREATERAHASVLSHLHPHRKTPNLSGARITDPMAFAVDSITMARWLLGARLVRTLPDGQRLCGKIVECEAYLGPLDAAAHSYGMRRSERNESMYQAGGTAYVYMIYGLHHCLNIVCGAVGEPTAVLVRALEPLHDDSEEGMQAMLSRRRLGGSEGSGAGSLDKARLLLCSGPGRLCQALGIDRELDRERLVDSPRLWLEHGEWVPSDRVVVSQRIGVAYAGAWASAPLRFCVKDSPHVSKPWPWAGSKAGGRRKGKQAAR